jgi:hypothetical protein
VWSKVKRHIHVDSEQLESIHSTLLSSQIFEFLDLHFLLSSLENHLGQKTQQKKEVSRKISLLQLQHVATAQTRATLKIYFSF